MWPAAVSNSSSSSGTEKLNRKLICRILPGIA
jgi:hypothetical protein